MDTSAVIAAVRSCNEAQLRELEAATGVPSATLAKIRYGVTGDPRSSTVDKLRAHFMSQSEALERREAAIAAPAPADPQQARVA